MRELTAPRVLTLIAVVIALALGSTFFIPLTLGLTLTALLYPLVAALRRIRVPAPLGAGIAVLLSLAVLAVIVSLLEPPVRAVACEIPGTLMSARSRLQSLGIHLPGGDATGGSSGTPQAPKQPLATSRAAEHSDTTQKQQSGNGGGSQGGGIGQTVARAFGVTASVLFALVEVLLLAFFILAAGDSWRDKLHHASASSESEHRTLDIVGEVRRVVLRYLAVNVMINAAQGVLVALVLWPLGYPTPVLWGALTFLAEFIPYFGGATMVVLLLVTGISTGHGLGYALVAPAAYLVITTLQNNLVSPAAYGRELRLNPAAILAAVMFWGLVWGIVGAFLAVPLLAALRIIAEKQPSLRWVAVFLSD